MRSKLKARQIQNLVNKELDNLIDNTYLSNSYVYKWSGIVSVDGKYIKVRGYKKKIPFIYCLDYYTHDIICGVLAPSENREVFHKLFRLLKTVKYPLKYLICDDVLESIGISMVFQYPKAKLQLCLNHYIENLRTLLKIRSDKKHHKFFNRVVYLLRYRKKQNYSLKKDLLNKLLFEYRKDDLYQSILLDIYKKRNFLFLYLKDESIPQSNNLIELFNSHLQGRLKTIKGFSSFKTAERFLNAWMIRRRTIPFTDCSEKFKHLNGKLSLEFSLKNPDDLKKILKTIY